jgi:chemotaxis protein methyltransferase CheR
MMNTAASSAPVKPPVSKFRAPMDPVYRQIRDLIYKASGIFQLEEKLYLLADGCGRRMKELQIQNGHEYWKYLNSNINRDVEMRRLLNEITIGETSLFRSQPQLDALRKVILPEIIAAKNTQANKRLRIWSAGCSTGEEPYTLAMSLLEEGERSLKGWTIEIVATDLNDRSVETAKTGIYGDYALRNTTEYFRRKYFVPANDKKLQAGPAIKKLITFSRLNLQEESKVLFMKGMDLIFCCNVLIYFDIASKCKVIQNFYKNLNYGGYFFLGTSESLMNLNTEFHLVHFPGTIGYWKPPLNGVKP